MQELLHYCFKKPNLPSSCLYLLGLLLLRLCLQALPRLPILFKPCWSALFKHLLQALVGKRYQVLLQALVKPYWQALLVRLQAPPPYLL